MPTIQQLKSDPKMKHLSERIHHTIDISMERVAAHLKDPAKYPLPSDPKSVERAVANLMALLPDRKKKKFIKAHEDKLTAGAAKRKQWYGDLADVDFKSSKSIGEQVKAKKVPEDKLITEEDFKRYRTIFKAGPATKTATVKKAKAQAAPAAATPGSKLFFNMVDLTCNRTSEIRKDEISIGALFIDATGTETSVDAFEVGDFKKGDVFPFAAGSKLSDLTFEILQDTFPQSFTASFFLLEKDLLRNSKVVNAIGIVLTAIFALAAAVSFVCLIAALITMNVLLATIGLIAFAVMTGASILLKVLSFFADDFTGFSSDVLVFDTTLPNIGDEFSRSVEFSVLNAAGGIEEGLPGKYTANFKWSVK